MNTLKSEVKDPVESFPSQNLRAIKSTQQTVVLYVTSLEKIKCTSELQQTSQFTKCFPGWKDGLGSRAISDAQQKQETLSGVAFSINLEWVVWSTHHSFWPFSREEMEAMRLRVSSKVMQQRSVRSRTQPQLGWHNWAWFGALERECVCRLCRCLPPVLLSVLWGCFSLFTGPVTYQHTHISLIKV